MKYVNKHMLYVLDNLYYDYKKQHNSYTLSEFVEDLEKSVSVLKEKADENNKVFGKKLERFPKKLTDL